MTSVVSSTVRSTSTTSSIVRVPFGLAASDQPLQIDLGSPPKGRARAWPRSFPFLTLLTDEGYQLVRGLCRGVRVLQTLGGELQPRDLLEQRVGVVAPSP